MIYRSMAHQFEISSLDGGNLWISNPIFEEEHLENGQILYWCHVFLPCDTFQGVGVSRFDALRSLNEAINNKIGANNTDFIVRNYFFPVVSNC